MFTTLPALLAENTSAGGGFPLRQRSFRAVLPQVSSIGVPSIQIFFEDDSNAPLFDYCSSLFSTDSHQYLNPSLPHDFLLDGLVGAHEKPFMGKCIEVLSPRYSSIEPRSVVSAFPPFPLSEWVFPFDDVRASGSVIIDGLPSSFPFVPSSYASLCLWLLPFLWIMTFLSLVCSAACRQSCPDAPRQPR